MTQQWYFSLSQMGGCALIHILHLVIGGIIRVSVGLEKSSRRFASHSNHQSEKKFSCSMHSLVKYAIQDKKASLQKTLASLRKRGVAPKFVEKIHLPRYVRINVLKVSRLLIFLFFRSYILYFSHFVIVIIKRCGCGAFRGSGLYIDTKAQVGSISI